MVRGMDMTEYCLEEETLRNTKYAKWEKKPERSGSKKAKGRLFTEEEKRKAQSRLLDKAAVRAKAYGEKITAAICGESSIVFEDGSSIRNKKEVPVRDTSTEQDEKLQLLAETLGITLKTSDPEILKFFTDPKSVKAGGKYYLKDEYVNGTFVLEQVVPNKSVIFVFRSAASGFRTTYSSYSLKGLKEFRRA